MNFMDIYIYILKTFNILNHVNEKIIKIFYRKYLFCYILSKYIREILHQYLLVYLMSRTLSRTHTFWVEFLTLRPRVCIS